MPDIVMKKNQKEEIEAFEREFMKSISGDRAKFKQTADELAVIIMKSFEDDKKLGQNRLIIVPGYTNTEQKEFESRLSICLKWFMIMIRDMKWSPQRALDHLPYALRAELNGEDWEPPGQDKAVWAQNPNKEAL